MNYNIEILNESGYEEAMLGLSLSFNQPVSNMKGVSDRLYDKDGGHNKFLESVCVWLDITMPRYWWSEADTYRISVTKQSECYDDKTEVLTNNGWKYFRDIIEDDKFYTLNPTTKEIELQNKTNYFESDFCGSLVSLKSKKFDLLVTPNHSIPIIKDNKISFTTAEDFKQHQRIPKNIHTNNDIDVKYFNLPGIIKHWDTGCREVEKIWEEKQIIMDDWLSFFGFWLAEGRTEKNKRNYNTYLYQKNTNKCFKDLIELLDRLPFIYSVFDSGGGQMRFTISDKQLYEYLSGIGDTYTKYIPENYLRLSQRQSNILLDWMMLGDGTENKEKSTYLYSTVSKKLCDCTQELMLRCGYISNVYERVGNPLETTPLFTINRSLSKSYMVTKQNIKKVFYEGKVYCVEVPNHILMVRRNGKATWCGNSTMHTITKRELTQNDFVSPIYEGTLEELNLFIRMYNNTDDKDSKNKYFKEIKNNLPEGFLQRRVLCTNYKTLRHIISQRKNHKLDEWKNFCTYLKSNLRYKEWLKDL